MRSAPDEVEAAAEERGEPLGLVAGGAANPRRGLAVPEGLDRDLDAAALLLVTPGALHPPVHEEHRRDPALRAENFRAETLGEELRGVRRGADDEGVERGKQPHRATRRRRVAERA